MATHTKKVFSSYFEKILSGDKTYEVRLADWRCDGGDTLHLVEIDDKTKQPTGRTLDRTIDSVIRTKTIDERGWWSQDDIAQYGYQVLALVAEESVQGGSFHEMQQQALAVRDHYDELQETDGHKKWNASDRMAGFVGDVGDLSKLVMAKQGIRRGPDDIDEVLAHELSDCLWSVLVLADELNIDLEAAFTNNMKQLHERIEGEKRAKEGAS
jgi:NTP pyrophosphatase (non-canonical NTP hydrolase)